MRDKVESPGVEAAALALYLDNFKHWQRRPTGWGYCCLETREEFRRRARLALDAAAAATVDPAGNPDAPLAAEDGNNRNTRPEPTG